MIDEQAGRAAVRAIDRARPLRGGPCNTIQQALICRRPSQCAEAASPLNLSQFKEQFKVTRRRRGEN